MNIHSTKTGYILLITILIIGAMAAAILSSLLMLGISANQVSLAVSQANQALANAQGCAEYGLLKLRQSPSYAGSEFVTIGTNQCEILSIGGIGNNNRVLCTEGNVGDSVRRLEIVVKQVLPTTLIYSWQEVSVFSLCQ
jgi:type II secretory pathway pseudopilin PulG